MNKKRETLKKVAGVSAIAALTPTSWTKPVLNSVMLPLHAQTSNTLKIDVPSDVTITPATEPDDQASGLIGWFSYIIGNITGEGIQDGARYSLLELPEVLRSLNQPLSSGLTRARLRVLTGEYGTKKGQIDLYVEHFSADINGEYDINLQVENPNSEIDTTTFKLTFEGF